MRKLKKLKKSKIETRVKKLPEDLREIYYADGSLFFRGYLNEEGANQGPSLGCLYFNEAFPHPTYQKKIDSENLITYRIASTKDWDKIIDLRFQNYFDGNYNTISSYYGLFQEFNDDTISIVAEDKRNNLIVGQLYATRQSLFQYYLDDLFVAQIYRKKRIATKLLTKLEKVLTAKDIDRINLKIIGMKDEIENVKKLYSGNGYVVSKEESQAFGLYKYEMFKSLKA